MTLCLPKSLFKSLAPFLGPFLFRAGFSRLISKSEDPDSVVILGALGYDLEKVKSQDYLEFQSPSLYQPS